MEDKDLLRHAVEALERLGLRYLVTGSYIKEWAERLGLEDIWQMILERLEPARPDPRAS